MPEWPHAPTHHIPGPGTYMVTASTYGKLPLFHSPPRLTLLANSLFNLAQSENRHLEAWAVFPNHYHFIAKFPSVATNLSSQLGRLHSTTAKKINLLDGTPKRQVWFQFWDSQLTYQRAYLARLNYVNSNPVHHGLVREPSNYPWCSASWFRQHSAQSFYKVVASFPTDRLKIRDDFHVDPSAIT